MISIRVGSRVLRRPQGKIRGKLGSSGRRLLAFSGNSPFHGPNDNFKNRLSIVNNKKFLVSSRDYFYQSTLILGPNQHVCARDWFAQSDLLGKVANIKCVATTVRSDFHLFFEPVWLVVQ